MKYTATLNGKQYEVELERVGEYEPIPRYGEAAPAPAAPIAAPAAAPAPAAAAPAPAAAEIAPAEPESAADKAGSGNKGGIDSDKVVASPLVGTFYSSSSPEAEPFVKEGDTVKKGQILGIIEAMKLMNEIESEYDGVVEAILVNNEDVVEYGQPLFRIR